MNDTKCFTIKDLHNAVISCPPDYVDMLCLLYPTRHINTEGDYIGDNAMTVKDIHSVYERKALGRYDNYLVISNKFFDFVLTFDNLKWLALEYRNRLFDARLRKLPTVSTVSELILYMHNPTVVEDADTEFILLVEQLGSRSFTTSLFATVTKSPPAQVMAAMTTVIARCLSPEVDTVFYKRLRIRLAAKLKNNLNTALSSINYCYAGSVNAEILRFINFHDKLFNL